LCNADKRADNHGPAAMQLLCQLPFGQWNGSADSWCAFVRPAPYYGTREIPHQRPFVWPRYAHPSYAKLHVADAGWLCYGWLFSQI
jgi:hypothetical protein